MPTRRAISLPNAPLHRAAWPVRVVGVLCIVGRALACGQEVGPGPRTLPQDAYVWQRIWTPDLRASVRAHGLSFAALDVLVAEVEFAGLPASTIRPNVDWELLRGLGRPVGLVVRAGAAAVAAGPTGAEAAETVISTCVAAVAYARRAGVEPAELQLDLDAPTSRLEAYRQLVVRLRRRLAPLPLGLTVLPDWLDRPQFAPLVGAAGSYVLQVHSLERPVQLGQPFALCDPARAQRWIHQAAALGVPFRVALPTYAYRVAFGPTGTFLGLQAEGPARRWPAGTTVATVWSDAAALAGLVHELLAAPPRGCLGLVWFRLPTGDDQLAWHWATLARVRKGQAPLARAELVPTGAADGEIDLSVTNTGDVQLALAPLRVEWAGARLIAADGINGWRIERAGGAAVVLVPPPADESVIFPDEQQQIGWIRLDHPTHIAPAIFSPAQ